MAQSLAALQQRLTASVSYNHTGKTSGHPTYAVTPRVSNCSLPNVPLSENEYENPIASSSTNRSLPANYGSSLQPINQRGRLVHNDNDAYTAYQSDRLRRRGHGNQYAVVNGDAGNDRLNRGASSAPGQKKLDRSRPLPKINTLVKGRAPDPLEKHLRQPPHRTAPDNSQDQSQQNGLPQTENNENGAVPEPETMAAHEPSNVLSSQNPPNVQQSSRLKPYPTRNRRRDRSSTPPEVPEHLISPPKSGRTIYFGPTYGDSTKSKSKMQADRDEHIRRQLALGHSNKAGILRKKSSRSRMDDAATTTSYRTDREGTKSIIVPRRERTRMQVNRARSELISRAKSKDDVRVRRTRNIVAVPTSQGTRKEKIDRDIYKLEEQMRIYLQMNGMTTSADEFDAVSRVSGTTFATSRASSPAKKKRNPYTDPKRTIPPWHRKEYVLNKRESQMYQHISKVYGNEKLRQNRENAFYKKVEALQLEEWNRLWEEYERKIRERDNKRKKQQVQLQHVRNKFTDDRWERIAKFPVNRIPVHDEDDRHDYGLPKELNENPEEYIPRVGTVAKPKDTFDTDIQTVKNVKRFHPIFQGYRGGPDKKRHPKMEGVDVVVLSDEEEDDNEGEPGGKRQRKKRVKVDALVKDAENAVEGASDESDWEDIEDAEDLHNRLRRGNKTPAGRNTNQSRVGFGRDKSNAGPGSTRQTPANSRLGVYNTSNQPKKLREKSNIGKQASQQRNTSEPNRATQDAYKPVGKSRFRPTVGDFRSGLPDGTDRQGRQGRQASTIDGKKAKGRKTGTEQSEPNVEGSQQDDPATDQNLQSKSRASMASNRDETNANTENEKGAGTGDNDGKNTTNVTTDVQDSPSAPTDQTHSGDKADDHTNKDTDDGKNKQGRSMSQNKGDKTGKLEDQDQGGDDTGDSVGDKNQPKSTKKVEFDTETSSKKTAGGTGAGTKPVTEKTGESNANSKSQQPKSDQAAVTQKDENIRGSRLSLSDKSGLNKRRGSKVSMQGVPDITSSKNTKPGKGDGRDSKTGTNNKDSSKDTDAVRVTGPGGKHDSRKGGADSQLSKRDSKLSVKGDAVSRDTVGNNDSKEGATDTPTKGTSDSEKGKKADDSTTPSAQNMETNENGRREGQESKETTKKDTKNQTSRNKGGQGTPSDKEPVNTNKSTNSKTTKTTTAMTTTKEDGKTDQDANKDKNNVNEPSQELDTEDAAGKENQQPKKQVRIISPEKPAGRSTRAVSPGVGKNRGEYKVPKKFEVTKSNKETTRAQSPSLFQKGLYNEPEKFEVRKSDKALTKADGPDLGHGEYTAPKPFETTKTERYIRGRSPFGPREKRSKTDIEPENYRRRTERTERTERKVRDNEPKRNTRVRNYNDDADDEADQPPKSRPVRGTQRRDDTAFPNEPKRTRPEPEKGGGRRVRTEVTETKTIRRRRPGAAGNDDDDDDAGRQATPQAKKKTVRKTSPRRRKESKTTKPPAAAVSQDHNRPDVPSPELDTSDDEDDIFERAKRKYGIVLDSD